MMRIPTFEEMLGMTDEELEALDKAIGERQYDGDGVGAIEEKLISTVHNALYMPTMCRECFGPLLETDTDGFCSDSCALQFDIELTWKGDGGIEPEEE